MPDGQSETLPEGLTNSLPLARSVIEDGPPAERAIFSGSHWDGWVNSSQSQRGLSTEPVISIVQSAHQGWNSGFGVGPNAAKSGCGLDARDRLDRTQRLDQLWHGLPTPANGDQRERGCPTHIAIWVGQARRQCRCEQFALCVGFLEMT